ncbi:hypothetical protein QR98_0012390 [Sarcoptes scabiei]|uniref:Uncharacterized protein n=1 Tax=Sarcoptes scabiei TaxID=52283 RepID=A0A131ZVI1_SARSC|nr:hypothetical protein QR98_0012390 [Sarcoptes scabiei]
MRTTDSSSATTPNILEPSKSLEMMIDDDINYRDPTVNVIVDKTIMKQSSSIEESRKPSLSKSVPQIQSKLPISSSMNTMSNVSQNGANNGGEIIHRSKLSIDELPIAIEDNEKLSIDFVLPNAISQSSMSLVSIPNDIVTINDISCDISDDEDNEKRSITDLCSNDEDHSQLSSTYQCFNEIGPETSHQKDTFVARKSQICDAVTKNDDSAMNSSGPELISSNSDIKSDQVLSNLIECDDVESLNSLNSIEIVSEMAINNTENTSTISFISSDLNATLINARATPTSEKQQPKGSNSINHRPLNETLTRRSKTKDSIPSSTSKTTFPEYTSSRQKSSDFSIHNKSSNKENRLRSNKINEIRYRSYQSNQRRPSSRQSVQSSSRCSTPSLSEHDSIVSTLSNGSTFKNNYKKSTEKISRQQPKTNTQQNQHRQQSSQKISNLINEKRLMMMVTSNTNTAKTTKLAPNKTETTGMTRTTAAMETNQKTAFIHVILYLI